MKILFGLIGVILVLQLFIRFYPSPTARWHRSVLEYTPSTQRSYKTVVHGNRFSQLHDLIVATPRTKVLAGSPDEKLATYVTRSLFWGFPDYTTIEQTGAEITIVGRSRFGGNDWGVNKARIQGWLTALEQL